MPVRNVFIARHMYIYKLKRSMMAILGHIRSFITRCCLCDFSLQWHPYHSAYLNCPNWVFADSVSPKINKHHRVGLAFSLVYKKQQPKQKHPRAYGAHKLMNIERSGHSAPVQIFLGGNMLMTVIIYSKDVLNFLSRIVKYFEYHWKARETEKCREKLALGQPLENPTWL